MDRKLTTFVSEVKNTMRELDEMKATQFSGDDNNKLYRLATSNPYDGSLTLANGQRGQVTSFVLYNTNLLPWQPTAFMSIVPQFWVNGSGNPYNGQINSGLAMVSPFTVANIVFSETRQQMINVSGSTMTIYVKVFQISTVKSASLTVDTTIL